jgi:hypothetical protein
MHNQWLSPGFLLWPTWKQNKIDNDIDNLFGPKSLYKKLLIIIIIIIIITIFLNFIIIIIIIFKTHCQEKFLQSLCYE